MKQSRKLASISLPGAHIQELIGGKLVVNVNPSVRKFTQALMASFNAQLAEVEDPTDAERGELIKKLFMTVAVVAGAEDGK